MIRIPTCKAVAQRGVLRIGCPDGAADVSIGRCVLLEAARGTASLVEYRRQVGACGPEAGRGPPALAFVVVRPHLYLVPLVHLQVRYRRGRAGVVVRPWIEVAAARPILYVVIEDIGAGVGRRCPGHRQAGGRCRLYLRPVGDVGWFVDVGYVYGNTDGGVATVRVVGFQVNRITVVILEVIRDPRQGAQLAAARINGEAGGIGAREVVRQPVCVRIGGAYRMLNGLTGSGVFGHGPRRAGPLIEGRRAIVGRRRWWRRWRRRAKRPDGSDGSGWRGWGWRRRHDNGEGRLRGVAIRIAGSCGDGRAPHGHGAHRRHRIRHRDRGDGFIGRCRAVRQRPQRRPGEQAGDVYAKVAAQDHRLVADDAQRSRPHRGRADNGFRPRTRAFVVQYAHAYLIRLFVGQTGQRDAGIRAAAQDEPLQPFLAIRRPMYHFIPAHRGLARFFGRRIPGHGQCGVSGRDRHARRRPAGGFVHVGDGDANDKGGAGPLPVAGAHGDGIRVPCFVVVGDRVLCDKLTRTGADGKTVCIHAAQAVREGVVIGVGSGDGIADGLARRGILFHKARDRRRGGERGRTVGRFAKTRGEDHEIVEGNRAVVVQIVRLHVLPIAPLCPEGAGKGHKVGKPHKPVAVEVRGRGRGHLQRNPEGGRYYLGLSAPGKFSVHQPDLRV